MGRNCVIFDILDIAPITSKPRVDDDYYIYTIF